MSGLPTVKLLFFSTFHTRGSIYSLIFKTAFCPCFVGSFFFFSESIDVCLVVVCCCCFASICQEYRSLVFCFSTSLYFRPVCYKQYIVGFFFFFFGCTHSIWKFPGHGSNLHHSSDSSCCIDNTGSLTHCTQGNA